MNLIYEYNWENNFDLSKEMFKYIEDSHPLGNSNREEALSRSIIHLSYYSCLHITKQNNLKYNQKNQEYGPGFHESNIRKIIKYKNACYTNDELGDIMADLLFLKELRTRADYKTDKIDFYETKEVFNVASEVYEKLLVLSNV